MEEADALSDRVAIIDHGKLLLLNAPDALKKTMGRGDVVELQLGDIAMNDAIECAYALYYCIVHGNVPKLQLHNVPSSHRLLQGIGRVKKEELAVVNDGDAIAQRIGLFHNVGG